MTAVATRAASPVEAGRSPFAGTGVLLRAALRRERRRLAVWVAALGLVTVYASVGLGLVYRTPAERQARAAVMETPAGIVLGGPGYGTDRYTHGAMIANELSLSVMVALAVMSLLLVVRLTRAAEESGTAEVVLAGAVGRRAPLSAALLLALGADLAVGVVVLAGLAGSGLDLTSSLALAAGWALTGAVFAGVGGVTAQLFTQARAASGTALAVLGAAAVVRGVGDVLHEHGSVLSWFSPIAWAQQVRAYVELRWWPLGLSVLAAGALAAASFALAERRDVGAGLVRPRRGPAHATARLAGPASLVLRLQRGTLAGWTAALAALGLTFGSLADAVTRMVGDNPRLAQVVGASGDLTDGFSAAAGTYSGLAAAGFAVASVLRARGEEAAGRTELLLSTPVGRRRLIGSAVAVAGGGVLLLLLVFGLADGLAASAALGTGRVGPQLAASLEQLPAVLVVAGAAAALVGGAPRLAPMAWLLLAWSLIAGMFGPLLQLPGWALHLSPFSWVPRVPAEPLDLVPLLGLAVVAGVLALVALAGFRRRDVPAL